ncbi:MAG: YegP family protein [Saprospiraceae bacterium]
MGKFVISQRKSGEFQFNLKSGNGQVILSSESYSAKPSCLNGIESVRKNSADDARFERKESSNGKYYFNLKSSNGQVVGSSQMYESAASCENGIESVKSNAPDATVEDETVA